MSLYMNLRTASPYFAGNVATAEQAFPVDYDFNKFVHTWQGSGPRDRRLEAINMIEKLPRDHQMPAIQVVLDAIASAITRAHYPTAEQNEAFQFQLKKYLDARVSG